MGDLSGRKQVTLTVMWMVFFAILVIVETFTMEFTCLCIAIGCLLGAGLAAMGLPAIVQVAAALAGTIAGLGLLAPRLRRHWTPRDTATGIDLIVGSEATVIEAIPAGGEGKIKLHGQVWQAVAPRPVPVGATVLVTELRGAKLTVMAHHDLLNPHQAHAVAAPGEPERPQPQQDVQ